LPDGKGFPQNKKHWEKALEPLAASLSLPNLSGAASDSFARLPDGTYGTNEQITAGKPIWSREHYCSDDFILTR
jgi:hypothetical protein